MHDLLDRNDRTVQPAKLLLVAPQLFGLLEGFSAGLVSLANYVAERLTSVQVELLDMSALPNWQIARTAAEHVRGPDRLFVGITTTTASYQSALRIARAFKEARADCVVVLGGHHAGPEAERILARHSFVDVVVEGEGEVALKLLLERYPQVDLVPNLIYRQEKALIHSNASSSQRFSRNEHSATAEVGSIPTVRRTHTAPLLTSAELDAIPITFRGEEPIASPGKFNHVTYVSARGCPLKCSFCAVANQVIRAKSVPAVIRDLRYLTEELGFSRIAIEDNFFAHSPKRTRELCEAIQAYRSEFRNPFVWDCQTRVESLRDETIHLMEKAGCEAVYLGVESLSPKQLLYLGKTLHPEHYLKRLTDHVVPSLLRSSVDCFINLQVGLPGEDTSDREQTISRLRHLGQLALEAGKEITVYPMLHVVYPGTQHFRELVAIGDLDADCFEHFTEWEMHREPIRRWLGARFAHGTGGIPVGILDPEGLRENRFEIDDRVFSVQDYLSEMEGVKAIKVFSYGKYLVTEPTNETPQ